MITTVRTAQAMPGKMLDLVAVGKEFCAIVKRVAGRDVVLAGTFGGNVSELAFISQWNNVGQLEDAQAACMADAEYRATLRKLEPLMVPGSGRDQHWRHI